MEKKKSITEITIWFKDKKGVKDFLCLDTPRVMSRDEASHFANKVIMRLFGKSKISKVVVFDTSKRTFENGLFFWEDPKISVSLYGYKGY